MFTYYQNFNLRREEQEQQREAEVTGHDRFCQERPGQHSRNHTGLGGVTSRRKRRGINNRRTHSAIEIESDSRGNSGGRGTGDDENFASVRSVLLSGENKSASLDDEDQDDDNCGAGGAGNGDEEERGRYFHLTSKIDSLARLLFNRLYAVSGCKDNPDASRNNGKQQYTALDQQQNPDTMSPSCNRDSSSKKHQPSESMEMEKRSRDRALSICRIYTRETPRYSLLKQLNNVGSRVDKHWFVVRDSLLRTERLLTLVPLNRNCSLNIGPGTRDVLNKLFLTLQHPYVCPILDLEFIVHESIDYVVLVQPINQGSLKDIIYGIERNCWNEEWSHKYGSRGRGLLLPQIQRMGRQVLEALVFLKERDFPTVTHLHSGNVIVQNGVARLAALENSLLGFTSRVHPIVASKLQSGKHQLLVPESIDTVCFGHMLFEMASGYELCTFEPTPANYSDVQRYPQVLECLRFIFEKQTPAYRYPSLEELILHDLFRNIDLRELRNASVNIFRPDITIPISRILDEIKCQGTPVKRSSDVDSEDMISLSSPESDCSENCSMLAQIYNELSITSV
ncbi:hypothetical protein QAD02_016481 [Eretmocerus hayati]|uniref:Uncharacterized protein n=1 Tax=Eretmocerus hayati TaxID=131215 RepID=A0ACC2PAQ5_9HYME|nr:hypothetical protein QAD02_016481 [Eretmocerus hayati]